MGLKVKPGMWCEQCQRPIAAQKTTHRLRNISLTALAPLSGGLSLTGAAAGRWHCPTCGGPVVPVKPAMRAAQSTAPARTDAPRPLPAVDPAGPPPTRDAFPDRASYLDAQQAYREGKASRDAAARRAAKLEDRASDVLPELEALAVKHQAGEMTREQYQAAVAHVMRATDSAPPGA